MEPRSDGLPIEGFVQKISTDPPGVYARINAGGIDSETLIDLEKFPTLPKENQFFTINSDGKDTWIKLIEMTPLTESEIAEAERRGQEIRSRFIGL